MLLQLSLPLREVPVWALTSLSSELPQAVPDPDALRHWRLRLTGTEQHDLLGSASRGTQPGPVAVRGLRRSCTAS